MAQTKENKRAHNKKWRDKNKEKIASYNKNYFAENKETLSAKAKIYRGENKETLAAYRKDYYAKNKEKRAAYDQEWRDNNPDYQLSYQRANKDKMAANASRRRAQKKGNGVFTISNKFMKNLYNSPCVYCGASEEIEVDHLIPIVKGGRHSEGNLQPLCKACNNEKRAKLWIEFIAEKKGSQRELMV